MANTEEPTSFLAPSVRCPHCSGVGCIECDRGLLDISTVDDDTLPNIRDVLGKTPCGACGGAGCPICNMLGWVDLPENWIKCPYCEHGCDRCTHSWLSRSSIVTPLETDFGRLFLCPDCEGKTDCLTCGTAGWLDDENLPEEYQLCPGCWGEGCDDCDGRGILDEDTRNERFFIDEELDIVRSWADIEVELGDKRVTCCHCG